METISTQLEKLKVEPDMALLLKTQFEPFETQAAEWKEKAGSLIVSSVADKELMEEARKARLALRQIRISVDKKHKELKERALKEGRMYDLIKNHLNNLIEPIEEHLQLQEDFEKNLKAQQLAELTKRRIEQLIPYMGDAARSFPVGDMLEDAFNNLLTGQRLAHAAAIEAEEARLKEVEAQKQRDREAAEEIRQENARLTAERDVLLKKQREEKAEADKIALEERTARLKAESELREREAAEALKKKEEAAAKRKAARAPDREKVLTLIQSIRDIKTPSVSDEDYQEIVNGIVGLLAKTVDWGVKKMEKM